MRLQGIRAVVTGGSRGMGRAFVEALAQEGAKVAVLARRSDALDATVAELGDAVIAVPCDMGTGAEVSAAIDRAAEAWGGLDVLVNNAAVMLPSPIFDMSESHVERQLAVNLSGPIHACRAAIRHMKAIGGGHIVNVTSESVKMPVAQLAIYGTTKAALEYFTQALRMEVRPDLIRVTALRSGFIAGTELGREWEEGQAASFYASSIESGLFKLTGMSGTPPEIMAEGLISVLALPKEVNTDLIELRPTGP